MTDIEAIIALAKRLADDNSAQATALLVGALTMLCAQSSAPIATLQVSIDSLVKAQDICVARATAVRS